MEEQKISRRQHVRKRLYLWLCIGMCCGMGLWLLAPSQSLWEDMGAIIVAACAIPVFASLQYLPWGRRHVTPAMQFLQSTPVPELAVNMRLIQSGPGSRPAMRPGRHVLALVVGTEGHTVRFDLPEGVTLDAEAARRVEVQFLNPALALPHFVPGTAFRMLNRQGVIGEGAVIGPLA